MDLRFFIATQRLNCLNGNLIFIFLLVSLSVGTLSATFIFASILGSGAGPVVQAVVFVIINIITAKQMSSTTYHIHDEVPCCFGLIKNWRKLKPMSEFPTPCIITLPSAEASWFGGVFVSHDDIFKFLERAISKSCTGDHAPLMELGDPKLITQYMSILTELDGKKKRKNANNVGKRARAPNGPLARFYSLSPLVALLLGIVNLFQACFDVAETYSPTESFFSAQLVGFFSSPGGTETVKSNQGASVEIPSDIQISSYVLTVCYPDMSKVNQQAMSTYYDNHVGATLTCPPQLAFYMIALVSLISMYFCSWVAYRLILTWHYKVNDLRFLIATDRANNLRHNFIFCCVGIFLSVMALLAS